MGITLVIVGGVLLISVVASVFDYLGKRKSSVDIETKKKVDELERKMAHLEAVVEERNDRILQLENDLAFMNKLIEKK